MKKGEVLSGIITFASILIIIVVILFIGHYIYSYASYGAKEGTIIDKHYNPAYTYVTTTTSYVNGNSVNIPTQHYQAETYTFTIQKEINGKIKTVTINVTKEEFEKFNIGEYFKR